HISAPQQPRSVRIFEGGSVICLRGDDRFPPPKGACRGRVAGFTRASRRRLIRLLQSVHRERAGLPLFVTLTYPREWPGSPKVWKRDLDAWLQRLKRAHPEAWAVWRLEPQRRGAPHYHLLVFGADRLPKQWLSRTWFEVVGSGDERPLRAGTQVQRSRQWNGVVRDAAKYLGKLVDDLPEGWRLGVGRWWGVHNRQLVPRAPVDGTVRGQAFTIVKRVLRRYLRSRGVDTRRIDRDFVRKRDGVVLCRGVSDLPTECRCPALGDLGTFGSVFRPEAAGA
ncbi:MAG: hypothetical protein K8H99_10770, partial [Nitrospirae bacterium]|nr:hypothetical protein [Fimbriimonadaceae bacterium]